MNKVAIEKPGYVDEKLRHLVRGTMIRELYGNDDTVAEYVRDCVVVAERAGLFPDACAGKTVAELMEVPAFSKVVGSAVKKALEQVMCSVYLAFLEEPQFRTARRAWDNEMSSYAAAAAAVMETCFEERFREKTIDGLREDTDETVLACAAAAAEYRTWRERALEEARERILEAGRRAVYTGPEVLTMARTAANLEAFARYSEEEIAGLAALGRIELSGKAKKSCGATAVAERILREAGKKEPSWEDLQYRYRYQLNLEEAHALKQWREELQRQLEKLAEERAREEERKRLLALEKAEKRRRRKQMELELRRKVLTAIPDHYKDLYPMACAMRRRFILHIGPTNSGKTHTAMERLAAAESGVYLGPLRLLAFEQFERLNGAGAPCSLVTGEERILVPGAQLTASTVEMASLKTYYQTAVIDEAQMITDPDRGGAWSAAILGLCAEEIHVLASPDAKDLLLRVIGECSDSVEVVEHERLTPLAPDPRHFRFPRDVQPGDALIVFSRRSVHAVAALLQEQGTRCSVIYGALPYDVRHEQARRFAEGENGVVVATDAIGLGMNLPIRRVVFLETDKFDGREVRPLSVTEIKQIAGRAGRFGIYPEGRYTTIYKPEMERLKRAVAGPYPEIGLPVITFPESLLTIDAGLKDLIRRWDEINTHDGWSRESTERMLLLLEMLPADAGKELAYDLITMPFDEKDERMLFLWKEMAKAAVTGRTFEALDHLPRRPSGTPAGEDTAPEILAELEENYRVLDLLYTWLRKFDPMESKLERVMEEKNETAKAIMHLLESTGIRGRRCKVCGAKLPWNSRYGMCEHCYSRRWLE